MPWAEIRKEMRVCRGKTCNWDGQTNYQIQTFAIETLLTLKALIYNDTSFQFWLSWLDHYQRLWWNESFISLKKDIDPTSQQEVVLRNHPHHQCRHPTPSISSRKVPFVRPYPEDSISIYSHQSLPPN